ncbi:MAG TPA: hypothetical protein GXX34_03880 [Clostridia bacterium]|nr:hypothetical protein [Clostridia bacterium]
MTNQFQFQQLFAGLVTPFIFTVPRFGFFVALYPRPHLFHNGGSGNQAPMSILRITEQEYMFLRRIGIAEAPVSMGDGYRGDNRETYTTPADEGIYNYMPDQQAAVPFPWPVDLSNAALAVKEGFLYILYTDRPSYLPGQPVHIMFIKTNISPVVARLVYPTSQRFDIAVLQNEREIWRWSKGRVFLPAVSVCELPPGHSQVFSVIWEQEANNELGLEPGPGLFTIRASNTAAELQNQSIDLRLRIQQPTAAPTAEPGAPRNLLFNSGFEDWTNGTQPASWVGSNIQRSSVPYTGRYALQLGSKPCRPAYISQEVPNVAAGHRYRLVFHARTITEGGPLAVSDFALTAEAIFLNDQGLEVGRGDLTVEAASIPENHYQQYYLKTGPAPPTARTLLVQFTFEPAAHNTNRVVIDDTMLTAF